MSSASATDGYVMNQTMLRVRDPGKSVEFYQTVLGMRLLRRFDFPDMKFSLYFLGYIDDNDVVQNTVSPEYLTAQSGVIELTHNHGTENDSEFTGYHDGNANPKGFGHIGVTVPDVEEACARFEELGVEFVKRPNDGGMKGIAFIKDPDGYWIEILSASALRPFFEE